MDTNQMQRDGTFTEAGLTIYFQSTESVEAAIFH